MCIFILDIKYQLHLCLVKLKDNKQALSILHSVPPKQRKTKIHMAIAKLNHQLGNIVSAATAYNKVLKVSIYFMMWYSLIFFFNYYTHHNNLDQS